MSQSVLCYTGVRTHPILWADDSGEAVVSLYHEEDKRQSWVVPRGLAT
jgi:hypothetical protein